MALIQCSECGRSVSDKASACVGCGAPISSDVGSVFSSVPVPSKGPTLTRAQLRWRALLASATFIAGLMLTIQLDRHGGSRIAATLAALLLISGLCWLIVAMVQNLMARR
jgi:hypothetical protein